MNLYDYQVLASRTAKPLEKRDDLLHGSLGLCTEAGEIGTTIKAFAFYNKPLDNENLVEELGDALWFLARVASAAGLSLSSCASQNIQKLQARYPEAYSDEDAIERKDKL